VIGLPLLIATAARVLDPAAVVSSVAQDSILARLPAGVSAADSVVLKRFAPVITDGYVNLYALFVERALQWVRPGGIVCLIIPVSFVGGPYFAALRKRILDTADVLRLDLIDKRSDVWAFGWCVQRKLARSVGNRPTRARVRSPVAWIARRRETNFRSLSTKPSSGWRASHRAVTRVNAQVTPKAQNFGGRAPQPRAKAA